MTAGKARSRYWAIIAGSVREAAEEVVREWPQGEISDKSRWITDRKQVGTMKK